jgi:glycosyltransferase involved in cell wall biosynthesis
VAEIELQLPGLNAPRHSSAPNRPSLDATPASDARLPPLERISVSLVIPTLNEADGLREILPRLPELISELIIVDGGSTDGSCAVVDELRPDAFLVEQSGRGKGNAIKEGLSVARGDIIVTMDADGSMRPEDIPRFVDRLLEGHDFVKGSRELPGAGSDDFTWIRRFGNTGLTWVANRIFGTRYTDLTFGFNAYWRRALRNPECLADGFQFEIQAAVRAGKAGLRTSEVSTHEDARVGGHSKLNAMSDGWAILKLIVGEAHPRRVTELRSVVDFYVSEPDERLRVI